jgi:hypothetical protein
MLHKYKVNLKKHKNIVRRILSLNDENYKKRQMISF